MAIPTFKAAGTFTSGTGNITPPYPTGGNAPVAGDIAILIVESCNETIALGTPAGFAEMGDQNNKKAGTAATTPASRLAIYWKRCVGGDTAPTITDPGNHATGRIYLFSGCTVSGNPWNVYAEGNDGGVSDQTASIPGATTTVADCLILTISSSSANTTSTTEFSGWTNGDLGSLTEIGDATNTAGLGGGHGIATGTKASAGAYGATTVNLAYAASYKGCMSIALKPPVTYYQSLPATGGSTAILGKINIWSKILSVIEGAIANLTAEQISTQIRRPTYDYTSFWGVYPTDPTTRWDKVDEESEDDDSTYIYYVGSAQMFNRSDFTIPSGSIIKCLKVFVRHKKIVADSTNIRGFIIVGGSIYNGTDFPCTQDTWITNSYIWYINPATGLEWTVDQINGVGENNLYNRFGITKALGIPYCTQCYLVVDYVAPESETYYQTLPASSGSTATLTMLYTWVKLLEAMEITERNLITLSSFYRALPASGGSTATLSRLNTFYRTLAGIAGSTGTLLKGMYQLLASTAGSTATLVTAKMYQKLLEIASVCNAVLNKIATYYRSLTATGGSTGTLEKVSTYYRLLDATETAVSTLLKGMYKTLSVIEESVNTLVTAKFYTKLLTATETAIATLLKGMYKTLSGVASSTATIDKLFTWVKNLSAQGGSTATLLKGMYQTLSAIEVAIASLETKLGNIYYKTLEAIAGSTAQISKLLTWTKSLSATEITTATMTYISSFFRGLSATEISNATLIPARLWVKQLISTAGSTCSLIANKIVGGGIKYIRKVFYNVQRRIYR